MPNLQDFSEFLAKNSGRIDLAEKAIVAAALVISRMQQLGCELNSLPENAPRLAARAITDVGFEVKKVIFVSRRLPFGRPDWLAGEIAADFGAFVAAAETVNTAASVTARAAA